MRAGASIFSSRPFFTMLYPRAVIPNEVRDLLFCWWHNQISAKSRFLAPLGMTSSGYSYSINGLIGPLIGICGSPAPPSLTLLPESRLKGRRAHSRDIDRQERETAAALGPAGSHERCRFSPIRAGLPAPAARPAAMRPGAVAGPSSGRHPE